MEKTYPITGLKAPGDSPVPRRLEIRDLKKDEKQFTLFIMALSSIMTPEYRPKAARFVDLAGIHGMPYERWAGDPNVQDALPEGTWGGYCNHGSVLFPTWHRPYVLAVEQSVGEAAIYLAKRWTRNLPKEDDDEKTSWLKAAHELRFPFWDWTDPSTGTNGLPDVLQPQTFVFTLPGTIDGQPITSDPIDNPLAFYDFGGRVPDGFKNAYWDTPLATGATSFFENWKRTYRWPSSKENPIEDYIKIKEILLGSDKQRGSWIQLRDQVAKLFTFPDQDDVNDKQRSFLWDEFSNTTFQSKDNTSWKPQEITSIESPHNSVHLVLGGLGDMANNDYAGFDPIFYLHHCNIDRILAFWEYVYPGYWMYDGYYDKTNTLVPFTQDDGTWAEDDNNEIIQTSSLQPFRKRDQNYWDSNYGHFLQKDADNAKGYTYPAIGEVQVDNPLPTTAAERKKYQKIIHEHFGLKAENLETPVLKHPIFTSPRGIPDGHKAIDNYRRFAVRVETVGHAFNGSYTLQLVHKGVVISSFAVLSRGNDTQCAACKIHRGTGDKVRGIIDIPPDIVSSTAHALEKIEGAGVNDVADALRSSIGVRMVGPSGILLADARPETEGRTPADDKKAPLEKKITPKLELISAGAVHPRDGTGPIRFVDWTSHKDLLSDTHKWRTATIGWM